MTENVQADVVRPRWRRLAGQFVLLSVRMTVAVSKLLLTIYVARYLGLADLGIYGLLASGTTIVPAAVGFGMTDWVARKIVDMPRRTALPLMAGRLTLTLCVHVVAQPLLLLVDVLLGEPVPLRLAMMAGAILLLENLASDASDLLIARRHIAKTYALGFLRMGIWPLVVIAVGLAYPDMRTLTALMVIWIVALVVNVLVLLFLSGRDGRWRHLRPRTAELVGQLRFSMPLYLRDISMNASIFLDRFIISMFLSLELTGVYTFYWSIANVVHSLTVYGVLQAQQPLLVAAGRKMDGSLPAIERRLQLEIGGWAVLLALGATVMTPLLLPYLGRPLLHAYLPLLWLLLFAAVMRIAADGYGMVLLALRLDAQIAVIAVLGALASAVMNAVATPVFGLWGAATAALVVGTGFFVVRFGLVRRRLSSAS